jgi:hypothetical protein
MNSFSLLTEPEMHVKILARWQPDQVRLQHLHYENEFKFMMKTVREVTLDDRFQAPDGPVLMTGMQAVTCLLINQSERDRAAGLNTGGFVSRYRESPLGALDTALKEPGVDRSGEVLKHANLAGTWKNGGVLALAGDDYICKSSTTDASRFSFKLSNAVRFWSTNRSRRLQGRPLSRAYSRRRGISSLSGTRRLSASSRPCAARSVTEDLCGARRSRLAPPGRQGHRDATHGAPWRGDSHDRNGRLRMASDCGTSAIPAGDRADQIRAWRSGPVCH